MEVLERLHLRDAGLLDRLHGVHQIFPVTAEQPEGLREVLIPIAAAHAVPDLRLVVPSARVHESPELLRIAGRTAGGFPRQGVRFPGPALPLPVPTTSVPHPLHGRRNDALSLA